MTSLPLSDTRSGRHLVLAGSAATAAAQAVRDGQRWCEEQRLWEKANLRFLELAQQDRRRIYDEEDTVEEATARTLAFFKSSRFCIDQEAFEKELGTQPGRPLLCYSESKIHFQGRVPAGAHVIFFGDAEVDLALEPSADVSLCDRSGGKVASTCSAAEATDLSQPRVTLSEHTRVEVSGWIHANGWDDSVMVCTSPEASVHVADDARLVLGQAGMVWAGPGTTIALTANSACRSIELDDYATEGKEAVRVLGPDGALLIRGTDLKDGEVSRELMPGVVATRAIPF